MRALATGPRVALAADARRDAHHRVAREVAAAAAPRRHVVGARRDAHARSPGTRARWPPPRGFATGPSGVASAPPAVVRASASDAPDRGPGFGFGSRADAPPGRPRARARGRAHRDPRHRDQPRRHRRRRGHGRRARAGRGAREPGRDPRALGGVVPNLAREAHESAIDDAVRARSPPRTFRQKTSPRWPSPWAPGCPCACAWASSRRRTCVTSTGCPSCRYTTWKRTPASPPRRRRRDGDELNDDADAADADDADDADDALVRAPFPFLALLVSGGHNQLILARAVGEYRVLGGALDDAPARRTTRQPGFWVWTPGAAGPGAGGALRGAGTRRRTGSPCPCAGARTATSPTPGSRPP